MLSIVVTMVALAVGSLHAYNLTCTHRPFSLAPERYHIEGTHQIGVILTLNYIDDQSGLCPSTTEQSGIESVEVMELLAHLVEKINSDDAMLPRGVRLGLTVYDDYFQATFTGGQVVKLLTREGSSTSQLIAVLCCTSLSALVEVLPVLSVYRTPQISFTPTYDVVSIQSPNSRRSSFHLQIGPSLRGRVLAVVDILTHFQWSYVAVLYNDDEYGYYSFLLFEKSIKKRNICISFSSTLDETALADTARAIASRKVNVIVLLAPSRLSFPVQSLIAAFKTVRTSIPASQRGSNSPDNYIWVKASAWSLKNIPADDVKVFQHSFTVGNTLKKNTQLFDFMETFVATRNGSTESSNPWLTGYLDKCRCKWMPRATQCGHETFSPFCGEYRNLPMAHDAMWTIATALCAYNETGRSWTEFDREMFYQLLQQSTFLGQSGQVRFVDQEVPSVYDIEQLNVNGDNVTSQRVGSWDAGASSLKLEPTALTWPSGGEPQSSCTTRCGPREAVTVGESPCCVQCIPCETHERSVNGACTACPYLWWPDEWTCVKLEPSFTSPARTLGIVVVACSSIAIVLIVIAAALLFHHRNSRLIKAACRETSVIVLFGILLQAESPLFLLLEPSYPSCVLRRLFFHFPYTLIYGPTALKCIKIYRIFWMGRRTTQTPRFVGVKTQLMMILVLVALEALMITISVAVYSPRATEVMPSRLEPWAEKHCIDEAGGFVVCFIVNMALLVLCAALALKTRKLPDNFNESQQIAFSVNTVILLSVILLPVSFLLREAESRDAVVFACEIGCSLTSLSLLFLPKLYALYFIKEESAPMGTGSSSLSAKRPFRVTPAQGTSQLTGTGQ